ncbi:DNA polymerase I [Pseudoflavonifractor capillosus]|uniref:DNA polymerase I n=1 Tax=Pseudoflavonifractor capillosus TaxID=106588 RepID=UPI00195C94F5|nr:DNA polymerase I [Pseudoflavonifractor capillosus]MBM6897804.1 DNA polymerase I [Pseudoflavonifractor capillosus]
MKLMVIDGNSIVNRAFYGVSQNLSTREGLPTNAIFGFVNILLKLLEEEKPEGLAVAFDLKAPTFRHLAYEGYKAQRKGMPEELAVQMPVLKRLLDAMNIRRYELEGWEADDLLGTMARVNGQEGGQTVVVTGDKDSLQLITDSTTVKLVSTRMGRTTTRNMTPEVFREEYGFDPIHIIDLKALMGDTSDNIPGVKGIGEKTAMALLAQYPSIDDLYANLDTVEVKPAARKKLVEGEADARMSYDLATIRCEAPMDFHPQDTLRQPFHNDELYQLLLELEFSKLIDKLGVRPTSTPVAQAVEETPEIRVEGVYLTGEEQLAQVLPKWQAAQYVVVLPLPNLDGVTVSLSEGDKDWLYDVRSSRYEGDYQAFLAQLFGPGVKKVAHGVKELCEKLLDEGIQGEGFVFDTQLAAYLLDPTAGSYDLPKLSMQYFRKELEESRAWRDEEAFEALPDQVKAQTKWYEDNAFIDALYEKLAPQLDELGLTRLLQEMEIPLCSVLANMERRGVLVDKGALSRFGQMLTGRIADTQKEIYQQAGEEFNILSPKQLGHILFEKLGLPPVKKTKTGYSTNAEVLEKLQYQHPIVSLVLEYRQLTKLNSTYVEGLSKVIAPDGRIHTSFQNTVTATGRLSSTEPNLQNIPVRTALGAEMRTMFVSRPGWVLVDADYSQIELRLLAHMSGDEAMIQAFRDGVDIHTVTASQVFGVSPDRVTADMRRAAKAVNFGIVYGISPFSLSQDIHVSVAQAKSYMEKYFEHYAGVRAYMDGVVEQGKSQGYVSTMYGRRRWLPELKSSNFNTRSFGERVALNMPIQGTAADIIKLAMIRVEQRLAKEGLQAQLVLQVHDELIVECPQEEADTVAKLLTQEMEGVAQLAVPLTAEAKVGQTWAEAH